jgi:hypothetical protein
MESKCIEYEGNRNARGYGRRQVLVDGRYVLRYAHRLAYEQAYGPIPDGLIVMHTCDNPPCINVAHLRLGTKTENMHDMHSKGRHKDGPLLRDRTECRNGHPFPANLAIDKHGWMRCRACYNEARKRRRHGLAVSDRTG